MGLKIGILGEIRAGKDTVAKQIEYKTDGFVYHFAFSEGIHEVINMVMPEIYAQGKPREALQVLGQAFRQIKPDVWIDHLFNDVEFSYISKYNRNMIITDVRQPNEAKRLQEEGFHIIKVVSDKDIRLQRINQNGDNFDNSMLDHETETAVHQCTYDYLIRNNGSLEDLSNRVDEILTDIMEKGA